MQRWRGATWRHRHYLKRRRNGGAKEHNTQKRAQCAILCTNVHTTHTHTHKATLDRSVALASFQPCLLCIYPSIYLSIRTYICVYVCVIALILDIVARAFHCQVGAKWVRRVDAIELIATSCVFVCVSSQCKRLNVCCVLCVAWALVKLVVVVSTRCTLRKRLRKTLCVCVCAALLVCYAFDVRERDRRHKTKSTKTSICLWQCACACADCIALV